LFVLRIEHQKIDRCYLAMVTLLIELANADASLDAVIAALL